MTKTKTMTTPGDKDTHKLKQQCHTWLTAMSHLHVPKITDPAKKNYCQFAKVQYSAAHTCMQTTTVVATH